MDYFLKINLIKQKFLRLRIEMPSERFKEISRSYESVKR